MCTCCKTFPFVRTDPRMAHGPLEGTFYCPEAPTVINELQLPLDPKQLKYVDTICKSYPCQLLKAIFMAIDQRMKFDIDVFTHDNVVILTENQGIKDIGTVHVLTQLTSSFYGRFSLTY